MNKILIYILIILGLTGCYESRIKKAYEELQIGSSKIEIDRLFKEFKFIKEQTVSTHWTETENETRSFIWSNNTWEDVQPDKELVIRSLTFDGNTKVFTYLVDVESNWPNNKIIYYVAIFYDKLNDKVIGKAIMSGIDDPIHWSEKF